MKVNPRMLVLARESRGLSQAELAAAIEVSQGKISKYENGLLELSDDDLTRIAAVLDYEPAFFSETDQVYGLGTSLLFNRKRKTAPVHVQRRIIAQVNVVRMQIERLLRGAEVAVENRFERLDIDRFDGDAEAVARHTRSAWRLPPGPIANLTAAIESAGGIVAVCDFSTDRIDAAHMWLDGFPPMFFMNAQVPGDRHRFSLAHEVGHAIMHNLPSDDVEAEADRFASEFLMPADEIGPQLIGLTIQRAAQLKMQWKVSMQAIIVRAWHLRRITEQRYRSLYTQISVHGYRRNEPFPIPFEQPTVLAQLIKVHQEHHGYSEEDMGRLLFTHAPVFFGEDGAVPVRPYRVLRLEDYPASESD
ncbi:MAG: ImmA/IrrE family metallo-endopeptidase [Phycisphaerae bacterium]|nr:ImmA/IrrE family metallo-endopeptidase [Phycisphaerae bacterium]